MHYSKYNVQQIMFTFILVTSILILQRQIMEVPGKRLDPDHLKSSDEKPLTYCQPCQSDGKRLPAEGYCKTCGEYLCKECFSIHTKPSPLKHHVLLGKSSLQQHSSSGGAASTKSSVVTIGCPDHKEEIVKFFCPSHDSVLCGVCAVLSHKTCAVEYIPDSKFAQKYKDSEQYNGITESLDKLDSDISACLIDVSENVVCVKEKKTKAVSDIRNFRKEINRYLDQQEQVLLDTVLAMQIEDQPALQNIAKNLDLLKRKVMETKHKLQSLEAENNNLFVVSKQVIMQMTELQKSVKECIEMNQSPYYKFKPNESVKKLLSSKDPLGSMERSNKTRPLKVPGLTTSGKTSTPNLKSNSCHGLYKSKKSRCDGSHKDHQYRYERQISL